MVELISINTSDLFLALALMFGLSFVIGSLIKRFGLSVSIGYLLAGIILGLFIKLSSELNLILFFLSEFSILLLFLEIGFEIHIENIGKIRRFPLYISLLELLIAMSMSMGILWFFNIGLLEALIYGLIASFSSTVFTYKLLEDRVPSREEIKHTVLMVAAVEDTIIVIALSLIQGLKTQIFLNILYVVAVMIALFILAYEFTVRVLSKVITIDLNGLILLISYGLFLGAFTSYVGLSSALGGFVAGVTASHIPRANKLMDMFKPIRSIFLTLFLVSMGLSLSIYTHTVMEYVSALTISVSLVLIHVMATLIASTLAGGLGIKYGLETGFYLSTISELSLVIAYYSILNNIAPATTILTASMAIILGSVISSTLIYRREVFIPYLLKKISYEKISLIDDLMIKLRKNVEERTGIVYKLFIDFIHNVGEILLVTIILGLLIKYIAEHLPINPFITVTLTAILYVAVIYRLYRRSKDKLYEIIKKLESRIEEKYIKIIDRVYTSLIIFLSTYVALTILLIEYHDMIEKLVKTIEPHIIYLIALTTPPILEIIYMIYRIKKE
ncbi:MAG: hypothetical protein B6U89_01135 [Desulfurococcales archaeon ex4484_58]|nr:MAG: hypothetical protein B6U89_01135 [Desulfurococcales archaeon ex4484_58]